ncbi:MAG: cell division protein ZapA [Oscillospiraceae bacterium]
MNKVKINICGINYSVTTDNDADFVMDISSKLDREIKGILKKYPALGIQSAAVFCALQAYEERKKSEDSLDNLRKQLKEYMDEAGKLRDARDSAVMEADKLREKLSRQDIGSDEDGDFYEEDAEQLVLENTVTPAVTIPVEEKPARDAAPPRPNRAARRSKSK